MAFDAARGVMVLFGGAEAGRGEGSLGNDVWTWDGRDWTPLAMSSPAPSPRTGAILAYDLTRRTLIMAGGHQFNHSYFGDTWALDGSSWEELTSAGVLAQRGGSAGAYDSARSELVSFGGQVLRPGVGPGNLGLLTAGTFVFDGKRWSDRSTPSDPSPRSSAAMVFDQSAGKIVMFGGFSCPVLPRDLWVWNAGAWSRATVNDGPVARWGASMTYDEARSQAVLFGGSSAGC
ncbi:MAG: hypothetical protein NVS9B11_21630 [Candidatus Dormibacteraceae bacterium]